MKLLNDTTLLYTYELRRSLKKSTFILIGLSQPILYLLLFMPLLNGMGAAVFGGHTVIDVFLPGILVLLVFVATINGGFGTLVDLQNGMVERMRVTPASRFALLMAPVLVGLTTHIVTMTILVIAAIPMGFNVYIPGLLIAYILLSLLAMTISAFAIALALKLKNMNAYGSIVNFVSLPVILLSGILLPLSLAPGWMQAIAYANPLYYVIEAVRQLVVGSLGAPEVWQAFALMVPLVIVVLVWAVRTYRKVVA